MLKKNTFMIKCIKTLAFYLIVQSVFITLSTGKCSPVSVAYASTTQLPQTGQITCYDKNGKKISCFGTGQDGELMEGAEWPDPRFTDNKDGTLTDNLTGLEWLKDANCFGEMKWRNIFNIIIDFNSNLESSGCFSYTSNKHGWRAPDIKELESLVNAEEVHPGGWLNRQGFVDVQSGGYWSSTVAADSSEAWQITMDKGKVFETSTNSSVHLWPVRSGEKKGTIELPEAGGREVCFDKDQNVVPCKGAEHDSEPQPGVEWPVPRFHDNGDGTIYDNLTALVWLKDADCFGEFLWQESFDTIADFNSEPGSFGCIECTTDKSDWRLPNRRELLSLIDYTKHSPALPSGNPFLNVQLAPGSYWSSTTYAPLASLAWFVVISSGSAVINVKSGSEHIWPVRSGQSEYLDSADMLPTPTPITTPITTLTTTVPTLKPTVKAVATLIVILKPTPVEVATRRKLTEIPTPEPTPTPMPTLTLTPETTTKADFIANFIAGSLPLTVQFTDNSTGSPTQRVWVFGDGGFAKMTELEHPVHTYTTAGLYTVRLTVSNPLSHDRMIKKDYIIVKKSSTETVKPVLTATPALKPYAASITTQETVPNADFTANLRTGRSPLAVQFTDNSTGNPTQRVWVFGDGGFAKMTELEHPVHIFTADGFYTVKLTVSNSKGNDVMIKKDYIIVRSDLKSTP